jgi:hypothetical protein
LTASPLRRYICGFCDGRKGKLMRKLALIVFVVAALGVAATAGAGKPLMVKGVDISDSFVQPQLSAACGFTVTIGFSARASVTLWTDSSGLVVRELDTAPGSKVTYSSPNGSFSFEGNLVAHAEYPEGATVGAPATVKLTGLLGHAPGFISSDAGQIVIEGATVVDFDVVDGVSIPFTDGGDVTIAHGNSNSEDEVVAAICAALS